MIRANYIPEMFFYPRNAVLDSTPHDVFDAGLARLLYKGGFVSSNVRFVGSQKQTAFSMENQRKKHMFPIF